MVASNRQSTNNPLFLFRRAPGGLAVCLCAAMAVGCATADEEIDDEAVDLPERARHANLTYDGLEVEKADLNGDDEPDQWVYRDEAGNRVRVERDMNFDGDVDIWEHYDAAGELVEEEMNLDRTTHVDLVAFYSDGKLTRKKMAARFDGEFPIEQFFDSDEQLLRVERDVSGDGEIDVWEYYEDGERTRVGWDTTGDGQPDTFDQM